MSYHGRDKAVSHCYNTVTPTMSGEEGLDDQGARLGGGDGLDDQVTMTRLGGEDGLDDQVTRLGGEDGPEYNKKGDKGDITVSSKEEMASVLDMIETGKINLDRVRTWAFLPGGQGGLQPPLGG